MSSCAYNFRTRRTNCHSVVAFENSSHPSTRKAQEKISSVLKNDIFATSSHYSPASTTTPNPEERAPS